MITLESDKATMEIPSPHPGVVKKLKVAVGDKISEGAVVLDMEIEESAETQEAQQQQQPATSEKTVNEGQPANQDHGSTDGN